MSTSSMSSAPSSTCQEALKFFANIDDPVKRLAAFRAALDRDLIDSATITELVKSTEVEKLLKSKTNVSGSAGPIFKPTTLPVPGTRELEHHLATPNPKAKGRHRSASPAKAAALTRSNTPSHKAGSATPLMMGARPPTARQILKTQREIEMGGGSSVKVLKFRAGEACATGNQILLAQDGAKAQGPPLRFKKPETATTIAERTTAGQERRRAVPRLEPAVAEQAPPTYPYPATTPPSGFAPLPEAFVPVYLIPAAAMGLSPAAQFNAALQLAGVPPPVTVTAPLVTMFPLPMPEVEPPAPVWEWEQSPREEPLSSHYDPQFGFGGFAPAHLPAIAPVERPPTSDEFSAVDVVEEFKIMFSDPDQELQLELTKRFHAMLKAQQEAEGRQ